MRRGGGGLLGRAEHVRLHASLETRAACPRPVDVAAKRAGIAALHAGRPVPEGAGRAIGQPRG